MIDADFLNFLRAVGLAPRRDIDFPDGRLVRFEVEGDKRGSRNGWAVLHRLPTGWGVAGSWRTGDQHTWRERELVKLTAAERAEQHRQAEAASAARAAELAEVRAAARAKAERLWRVARPAADDHPYLLRKGVHSYGLKRLRDRLLVPARDADGVLHSVQFIDPDGTKRWLTGGRTAGCYCALGTPSKRLLIAEGFATAATLFEATGTATAVAFTAGNLKPVALALRSKFPTIAMTICADNDTQTKGNPGRTAALEAAQAAGALVALPYFKDIAE